MKNTSNTVYFFYKTTLGRFLLKLIMKLHLDRIAVRFLWSPWSKPLIKWYIKKNNLPITPKERKKYNTYRELFVRTRKNNFIDTTPNHLISPCDGWLSIFPIDSHSCFSIKNAYYNLNELLQDKKLTSNYQNGICMVFRLCISDYQHYCYIDDGFQGENHHIPETFHSVQPIAYEKYPVYIHSKRCWCLLTTEHFGPVVQCEIGALIVGDIFNEAENIRFHKGYEKGHFELAGSAIVLLFEPKQITLKPELTTLLSQFPEVRVTQGEWIGNSERNSTQYEA